MKYSKPYATPLRLVLKPSRHYLATSLSLHSLAFSALFFVNLPLPVKMFFCCALVFSFYLYYRKQLYVREILWREGNDWLLYTRDGKELIAKLLPSFVVNNWFAALNFKIANRRWRLYQLVFADTLTEDSFRMLKIRLKLDYSRPQKTGKNGGLLKTENSLIFSLFKIEKN